MTLYFSETLNIEQIIKTVFPQLVFKMSNSYYFLLIDRDSWLNTGFNLSDYSR